MAQLGDFFLKKRTEEWMNLLTIGIEIFQNISSDNSKVFLRMKQQESL